jgi:hypothetical protein
MRSASMRSVSMKSVNTVSRSIVSCFVALALVGLSIAQAPHRAASPSKKAKAAPAVKTHYYGAVDLGSKGTKAALYSFVTEDEGRNPVVIYSKTINTKLVSSMKDGKFTREGLDDAVDAVKQVVDGMKAEAAKQSINVDLFYVVGSSGVAKATNKE